MGNGHLVSSARILRADAVGMSDAWWSEARTCEGMGWGKMQGGNGPGDEWARECSGVKKVDSPIYIAQM